MSEETIDLWSAVDGTSQCRSLHWLEGDDHLVRCARREHGPDVEHRRNYDDGSWNAWTAEYGRVAREGEVATVRLAALREAEAAVIAAAPSRGAELDPRTGQEDLGMAAYVEGFHDAYAAVKALANRDDEVSP